MSSYKYYRKNQLENLIIEKRNKEQKFYEFWTNSALYFAKKNVSANQFNSWESKQSLQKSIDSYNLLKKKDDAAEMLIIKKEKLKNLLEAEEKQYQDEIKTMKKNQSDISILRNQLEKIKLIQLEQEKQLVKEKLNDQWKLNNEHLRLFESYQKQASLANYWFQQIEAQKKKKEQKEFERMITLTENNDELIRQQEIQKQNLYLERLDNKDKMKKKLDKQMEEIKKLDEQAAILKSEEDDLQKQMMNLEEIQMQKSLIEEQRIDKKKHYGKALLIQHAGVLRRKSQKIQQELNEDRQILEQLSKHQKNQKNTNKNFPKQNNMDVQYILKVFDDQIKLEKIREAELDLMYREEAAKLWDRREAEWQREKVARQILIQQAIEAEKEELEERLNSLRDERQQSLMQRELFLADLQNLNEKYKQEEENLKHQNHFYDVDLINQVKEIKDDLAFKEIEDLDKDETNKMLKKQYEYATINEMQLIDSNPSVQKSFHRRKQAWT